jgi:FkbM family methyltransferase
VRGPLAQFRTLQIYARIIGWSAAFRVRLHDLILRRLNFQPACEIQLKLKNANYPLRMRTGKSSDREVLEQIFIRSEYEPVVLVNPNTIIDLGANVGYSSAYFLSRCPSTRVVAVEPDRENFLICRQNLAPFGARATVLHGAAWPERRELAVKKGVFGDGREWATQVCPPTDPERGDPIVLGYDIDSLIALMDWPGVDLLKIDIERSERELFSRNTAAWMPKIRNICIELHDEECAAVFFSALSRYTYDSSRSGELTICSNLRPLPVHAPPLRRRSAT